jgi:hypothetical protein
LDGDLQRWPVASLPAIALRIPSACCPALRANHQADSPDKICSRERRGVRSKAPVKTGKEQEQSGPLVNQ